MQVYAVDVSRIYKDFEIQLNYIFPSKSKLELNIIVTESVIQIMNISDGKPSEDFCLKLVSLPDYSTLGYKELTDLDNKAMFSSVFKAFGFELYSLLNSEININGRFFEYFLESISPTVLLVKCNILQERF